MEQKNQEMEKKYLITDEGTFKEIVTSVRALDYIQNYAIRDFSSKTREYRYFDNFEGKLAESKSSIRVGFLEREGASASVRDRKKDCVLTVKRPTKKVDERNENEFLLPSGTDFYKLNPNDFNFWTPLREAKEVGDNEPLQEVVRLEVQTNRFNLYHNNEKRVELALDDVLGKGPFNLQTRFYELEIENKGETFEAVYFSGIIAFFQEKYSHQIKESPLPKWIKALKQMRGEKLF